jgi:hypothetical protein
MDQPVNFEKMLEYQRPEIFDPVMPVPPIIASTGQFTTMLASLPVPRRPLGDQAFRMFNLYGSDGFGLEIASREGHALYMGQARFYMSAPRVVLDLKIAKWRHQQGARRAQGRGRLWSGLRVGVAFSLDHQHQRAAVRAGGLLHPGHPPVRSPFSVTIRQQLRLQTAFTGTGTLKARVRYELQGSLRAGYENGNGG